MSDQLHFMGTWDPCIGAFPVIPNDIDACYYITVQDGELDGYSFKEGDWLIYAEEQISPTESHGKWFRSEGGIVQVAVGTQPSDAAADPGIYTKITVNNAGIVTQGDYLEAEDIPPHEQPASTIIDFTPEAKKAVGPMFITPPFSKAVAFEYDGDTNTVSADVKVDGLSIIKDEFGQLKVNDEFLATFEGGTTGGDQPALDEHTHSADEIEDFQEKVREALAHEACGTNPFFSNTARSNAVTFNFDVASSTVSADVKIDNKTIVKNQYGQLVAVTSEIKAHTHDVADILGLEKLETSIKPAGVQLLTAPDDGDYEDGLHNLIGYSINNAFDVVNVSLKDLTTELEELRFDIARITPVPPPPLSDIELELEDSYELYNVLKAGTGEHVSVILDRTPNTKITPRFGNGTEGTIIALIDDAPYGEIVITGHNQPSQSGSLLLAENVDYYEGQAAFQGWHRSVRAAVYPTNNLSDGRHKIEIEHSLNGKSKPLFVDIAEPAPNPIISTNTRFDFLPPMDDFVSGVPCASSHNFVIAPVEVQQVVKHYYNPEVVLRVETKHEFVANEESFIEVGASEVPAITETFGSILSEDISAEIDTLYDEAPTFILKGVNIIGQEGAPYNLRAPGIRIDDFREGLRVRSGDPSLLYPAIDAINGCGAPWDPSVSLVDGYDNELQKVAGEYRWPNNDYTYYDGPDYRNAKGTRLSTSSNPLDPQYRWVTFKHEVTNLMSFNMMLVHDHYEPWPATLNKEIKDLFVFIKAEGLTGWLDANKPFIGFGGVDVDGEGALDVNKTRDYLRYVTLGAGVGPFTGDLYIRIGFSKDTDYIISGDVTIDYPGAVRND